MQGSGLARTGSLVPFSYVVTNMLKSAWVFSQLNVMMVRNGVDHEVVR